jgi:hypothetical protein
MMWVKWNPSSFRLEAVLVSVQDTCVVCARRTTGKDIVLDHSMVPPDNEALVEARFGVFKDSANLDAR